MTFQYVETILPGKITFSKTEIVNGIQGIGLAYPISSAYANYAFSKTEFLLKIILELKQRYGMKGKWQEG